MRAASEGAHGAGGLVIGILPNDRKRPMEGYPNEFVDIAVFTGMYEARNVINAKTPHCLIALAGGAGTLSEIALALRAGTPVIALRGVLHESPEYPGDRPQGDLPPDPGLPEPLSGLRGPAAPHPPVRLRAQPRRGAHRDGRRRSGADGPEPRLHPPPRRLPLFPDQPPTSPTPRPSRRRSTTAGRRWP